jgi:superfamily II DNA or RNA helicase
VRDNTIIKTTKTIYPQIYAYVIPEYKPNEGWIKIGYTEQKDVDRRIRQQTQTAGIRYSKLWSEPAKFCDSDEWFYDKQFHAYLRRFKKIDQRPNTEWFYYDGMPEQAYIDFDEFRRKERSQVRKELEYQLRSEQEDAVNKTLSYANDHPGGEFLWNAKPRFGKTLTAYHLARQMEAQNVLVVTNRPAIANSWFDDFETFIAWQTNYRFVSTTDSLKERPVLTHEQFIEENHRRQDGEQLGCIAFVSLQDLKGSIYFGGLIDKLDWVKDTKWDLLIVDEAHEGVDTFKTDIAFNNITQNFTLHLSGTPFKAVASGKFTEMQIFNWTYADEQIAKATWPEESEENNPYEGLPRLNLFSYQMSQMVTDTVNKGAEIDGKEIDFAFDLNEFFATNTRGKFIHEAEVKKWLDTLTRNEKYPYSTPQLRAELKHTLWLLNRVASAKALEKLLREHPVFENYEVVLAAGDGRTDEDDPIATQRSLDRVREAIKEHDRTITLSVGQLTTGVTIPEWTAVMMLSNIQSPSLYMQAAFRAQNQWGYDADGEKHRKQNAYVFDFAPERTLIIYDEFANNLSRKTVSGGGTTEDREENIRTLLNFFPVIAEDNDGKMVELDVRQVLTIPKTIKAQEIVKRGFMSNLLFQNISGVFTSPEAREILEQLNPVAPGKVTPNQRNSAIDTRGVEVNDDGEATVDPAIVVATTSARFGEKLYLDIAEEISNDVDHDSTELTNAVYSAFTTSILDTAKEIAKEHSVTVAQAEQIVKQNANILAREIEIVKKQADIRQAETKLEYEREVAAAENNAAAIATARARFATAQQEIAGTFERELVNKLREKTRELTRKTTEQILQKAEEKKRVKVEDDVRARLRGFARTIPSFLMAYGEPTTKLANFDVNIKDEVFKEVTGITLEDFRALRDKYSFFDPVVFDESVQEFLRKKEELANYFDENQEEDIFDYIPPQKTNQIYTPRKVVKLMIDTLEEENADIFCDKEKTFADLYVKSGLYLTEIVKRLFAGLEKEIPDEEARLKHILENQIYGFAPSEIIYNIARNFVFGGFPDIDDSHLRCLDLTILAEEGGGDLGMRFDVVVGNPPYQRDTIGDSTSSSPIYHLFVDRAYSVSDKVILITPARFLFNAGDTPKSWNEKMLNDEHLKVFFYEKDASKVFPTATFPGGVAITYRDRTKKYTPIQFFSPEPIINSIMEKTAVMNDSMTSIISGRGVYKLTDKALTDHPEIVELQSRGHSKDVGTKAFKLLENIIYFRQMPADGDKYVQVYGLKNSKRVFMWIKKQYLDYPPSFDQFKVFISKSNGAALKNGKIVGAPFVAEKEMGATETFLTIGGYDEKIEAENMSKYIKTKFARVMLSILKATADNTREKWAKVPIQNFTSQSDIDWTQSISDIDCQLYMKYGLDVKEIEYIEEKIKTME